MDAGSAEATQRAIARLFAAIEARDLLAIEAALDVDVSWQNVPHPAYEGREAVLGLLAPIVRWSDGIRWDITSASYETGLAHVERSDRFVIAGAEHVVECHGVFGVDADGFVAFVRDYADVTEWRQRIGPVYQEMQARSAIEVVARHLAAVERQDVVAMALDYALDATLIRNGREHVGYREIAGYFADVPQRLGGRDVRLGAPEPNGEREVEVSWSIDEATSGIDRYLVADGWIRRQVVTLDGPDF